MKQKSLASNFDSCGFNDLPNTEIQLQGRIEIPKHTQLPENTFILSFTHWSNSLNKWYEQCSPHSPDSELGTLDEEDNPVEHVTKCQ